MATLYFDHKDKMFKFTNRKVISSTTITIFAEGEVNIRRNMAGSYYAIDIGDSKEAIVAMPTISGSEVGVAIRSHYLARVNPKKYTIEMAQRLQTLGSSRLLHKTLWDYIGIDPDTVEPFTTVTTIRLVKSPDRKIPTSRLCEAQLTYSRSLLFYVLASVPMGDVSCYKLSRDNKKVVAIGPNKEYN